MSRRDDIVRIRHMLDHALEAERFCDGKSKDDLVHDRQLNLAIVRLLEIVGEAASRVTQDFQNDHPEIPWPQIVGLRNRIVHGYDSVDFDVVWAIIVRDLPSLIRSLREIVGRSSEGG